MTADKPSNPTVLCPGGIKKRVHKVKYLATKTIFDTRQRTFAHTCGKHLAYALAMGWELVDR